MIDPEITPKIERAKKSQSPKTTISTTSHIQRNMNFSK